MDPYDALFYDSLCIPETHPESLAVLGRLMGLPTAEPANCRVLELGCATGGNLIPMAAGLPGASVLGIDRSAAQVAAGNRLITRLGLTNVNLRQGDILDLNTEGDSAGELQLGTFDYIIAHGVYSWVPPEVQARLLWLGRRLLAPNGVFYVSYNVLPGWRMRGMLRDILRDACREHQVPAARLDAARAALERLAAGLEDLPGEAARFLREELSRVRAAPPSYLYFEYLAEHNQPVLFRDFAQACAREGLRYLCDTALHTLFPASLGDPVEQALADLEDGLDLEQWLDFIGNRSFRQSLLIRDDRAEDGDEGLSLDRFAAFSLAADLRSPDVMVLQNEEPVYFLRPSGDPIQVSHPLSKSILAELAQGYPDAVPLVQVFPVARARVLAAGGAAFADGAGAALAEVFGLFARGAVQARLHPRQFPRSIPAGPRARPLVRALVAAGQGQVPTRDHGNLELDGIAARLVAYLDGTRALADLDAGLAADLASGVLTPVGPGTRDQPGSAPSSEQLAALVLELLAQFQRYGLLEDGPLPEVSRSGGP